MRRRGLIQSTRVASRLSGDLSARNWRPNQVQTHSRGQPDFPRAGASEQTGRAVGGVNGREKIDPLTQSPRESWLGRRSGL